MGVGQKLQMLPTIIKYLKFADFCALQFIPASVPNDGFKLQAAICRTFYTVEVVYCVTYLFITLTHSRMSFLKILPDTFSDFFPNLNRHSN